MKPSFGASALLDLHVHTRWGSECAELMDPDSLPEAMSACGIHGVVITEHNTLWPAEEIARLNQGLTGRRVYGGVEVSTATHHFVVIGLDFMDKIHEGMPAEHLWRITRVHKAAMILAHPLNRTTTVCGNNTLPVLSVTPDAVEVASTVTHRRDEERIRAWGAKNHIHLVAGSDAHCIENLGQAVTAFPHLPENEKELARMIQNGLGLPFRRHQDRRIHVPC
ncbi:histidinol-phosphatase [Desulfoluna limicola]|uniref:Histidinol-phosphatase n=1 Tax=Desulfoluna limicola TaxID=2810562 RepID=A0ABM7PGA1_9BACT|nr:PHP domain-containing protein [Desulfoluna limicola]BCS96362.1 histidinol-phosphatase [Desulfoluna limicola]